MFVVTITHILCGVTSLNKEIREPDCWQQELLNWPILPNQIELVRINFPSGFRKEIKPN